MGDNPSVCGVHCCAGQFHCGLGSGTHRAHFTPCLLLHHTRPSWVRNWAVWVFCCHGNMDGVLLSGAWKKTPADKPDTLSLIPGDPLVDGEKWLPQVVLRPHVHSMAYISLHNKVNKISQFWIMLRTFWALWCQIFSQNLVIYMKINMHIQVISMQICINSDNKFNISCLQITV